MDRKTYDKMRPPRPGGKWCIVITREHRYSKEVFIGRATIVSFHVTVMSLDTIDEGSMVSTLSTRFVVITDDMLKARY